MSAGVQTPSSGEAARPSAAALPSVDHEVVDPAQQEAVDWLCGLLRAGGADLYSQDEADLSLLPTLTRTWMRRGEQLQVKAPGNNEKCSVSAAVDLGDGGLLWRTDEKRCARQFCATLRECAERSTARGRLAVLLTDNAKAHRVGKTGIVREGLDELSGRVVVAYLPAYSPHLQPAEKLWRQWRPNVTHNHVRDQMADLQGDSDAWLKGMAAHPSAVLQALGVQSIAQPTNKAA